MTDDFRRALYEQRWPDPPRCEVRSIRDRCPEVATFVISRGIKDSDVCDQCLLTWVRELTRWGPVEVRRIGKNYGPLDRPTAVV